MQTKSGKQLFPIGIGTWNIGGTFQSDPTAKYKGAEPNYENEPAEIEAIRHSLSKGQNHLDCAELYGAFHTDDVVGKALVGQEREDLYLADKLWRTSLEAGLVRPTVEKMLEKLGTDYLDMLYIHYPFTEVKWQEAVSQIDELIDEGIVRDFGVSNFTVADMQEAQRLAKHPIVANQMNYNVLYRDEVDQVFKDYCRENNIQIVAYQPVKRQEVLSSELLQEIAKEHGATPAQIALAWLIAQGTLPIPKAVSKQHIDENVAAAKIQLSKEDLTKLAKE
ncbi:aldo/keto reductase [Candidatus Saccharibacteria bacterium]|nr:MAG: aldo/keto reductase [Candidatus Saccharibacteria bacterium]